MEIRDLLAEKKVREVHIIYPGCSLLIAAHKIIVNRIGALVTVDEDLRVVGIVYERDLILAITKFENNISEKLVSDIMTRDVISCTATDSIVDVLNLMKTRKIRHIPVLDKDRLVGMIGIRDLIRAYEIVQSQAKTDSLTGLANRRAFLSTLETEAERARRYKRPLLVAMLDIDHFKHFNDAYGHATGDEVLQLLADLMTHEVRNTDNVGRIGGDEFAIIFPETDLESATVVCERLLKSIRSTTIMIKGSKISFTVSLGLALANPETEGTTELMMRTDRQLYRAKDRGRDCMQVDDIPDIPVIVNSG